MPQSPQAALKQYFGYESFRPTQEKVIAATLSGQDCMAIMPTGAGKSICYQIPAIVLPGVCVVVSPLIALMQDQVDGLRQNGVAAAFLNSSQSVQEQRATEQACLQGQIKLLYVSPEKILNETFYFYFLKQLNVSLFAIDEAHCVSFWGHDFRPEYAQLAFLKRDFPNTPTLALTATADRITRNDILTKLALKEPKVFIDSFDRPNLSLTVVPGRDRVAKILHFLQNRKDQSGIVYCLSRKSTEDMAAKLKNEGYAAEHYHAGMDSVSRARVQRNFLSDKTKIICATIAFGMGINKSNVRWIIHYNLPKNVESYYQEIGRSGRDGLSADTLLFYSYADVAAYRQFMLDLTPEQRELQEAKLQRLVEYAEAEFCRRKILLNYFGETLDHNCGNCDICKTPRAQFDGTILAQKLLSAVARSREQLGKQMAIDVLRGLRHRQLVERGFDTIKTHGAGRDVSAEDWDRFITQMINLGVVDIAYDEHHYLKLNDKSRAVLQNNEKVMLVKPTLEKERKVLERYNEQKPKSRAEILADELALRLKELRAQLAAAFQTAPDALFNDATLLDLVAKAPTTAAQLRNIAGLSEAKINRFGDQLLDAIIEFIARQTEAGFRVNKGVYITTFYLTQKLKLSPEKAAARREVSVNTILQHLARLYSDGYDLNPMQYLTADELERVRVAVAKTGATAITKEFFDSIGGDDKFNYGKMHLALAVLQARR